MKHIETNDLHALVALLHEEEMKGRPLTTSIDWADDKITVTYFALDIIGDEPVMNQDIDGWLDIYVPVSQEMRDKLNCNYEMLKRYASYQVEYIRAM